MSSAMMMMTLGRFVGGVAAMTVARKDRQTPNNPMTVLSAGEPDQVIAPPLGQPSVACMGQLFDGFAINLDFAIMIQLVRRITV